MKNKIIDNINSPENLEKLYRENKRDFRRSLEEISDDYDSDLLRFWKIRLASETEKETGIFSKRDLIFVILLSLFGGLLAKIPAIFSQIDPEFFFSRNLPVIVFNGIILYSFWQNRKNPKWQLAAYGFIVLVVTLFINLLPNVESDTVTLSLLHSPLLLWCLFCLSFVSFDHKNIVKSIDFIRLNGELIIMTGLILIAGGMLTGITIGLFSVIDIDIEDFYFEYVALTGALAAPVVAFYLIRLYPNLTSRIAPVIARVFAPLVLITFLLYLVTLLFSGSRVFEDRELLLLFNIMLIAVLALIVFSLTGLDKSKTRSINVLILLLLAALAIVINAIALFAIGTRVSYGITPNRIVVLVSNILIFVNLILIVRDLYRAYFISISLDSVEKTVVKYMTVYAVYAIIVVFILPFVFGFK